MKRSFKTMLIVCCISLVLALGLAGCAGQEHTHTPNADNGICDGCATQLDYLYDETTKTYTVFTADGLYTWAKSSENLVLGKDITLPGEMNVDLGGDGTNESNWTPVHSCATIDGNGHSITGMTVIGSDNAAFLNTLHEGGIVKDLSLKDVHVEGGVGVGGIVCYNNGEILNCSVSGSITGTDSNVGGIAGNNFGGSIIACHNTATVHSERGVVGGIVGQFNQGSVIACSNTGAVTANDFVGGIVGIFFEGNLSACYSTGTVTVTADNNSMIGGIVGYGTGVLSSNYWNTTVEDATIYGEGFYDSNDNADNVDGKMITWTDAMAAMNTALESAESQWRYAMNTGDDAASRPLVFENLQ